MNKINKLIDLNIKIEGLLRVLVARDSEAAEAALDECINEFNEIYDSIKEPVESETQAAEETLVDQAADVEHETVTDFVADVEPTIDTPIEKQQPEEQPEKQLEEQQMTIADIEPEVEPNVEPETEQLSEQMPEVEVFVNDDNSDTSIAETSNNIKVDEMISRQEAMDLKKAFTINDKFRFRRELFGGSEEAFVDTINLIIAMNSFDEAKEYIYDDLGFDAKNEDVVDFMAIISKHFNS